MGIAKNTLHELFLVELVVEKHVNENLKFFSFFFFEIEKDNFFLLLSSPYFRLKEKKKNRETHAKKNVPFFSFLLNLIFRDKFCNLVQTTKIKKTKIKKFKRKYCKFFIVVH